VEFSPTLVMSSNEAIKQAVMAGMAISLLSLHTVGREVAGKAIRVLDVEDLPIVRRWYLVHRADKRLSPAAHALRNFLLGEAGAIVDELMAPAIAAAKLVHRRLTKGQGKTTKRGQVEKVT
jgi:DNA-binding transcriptional LysR family regulator